MVRVRAEGEGGCCCPKVHFNSISAKARDAAFYCTQAAIAVQDMLEVGQQGPTRVHLPAQPAFATTMF
jgi:hypothetical protein